MSQLLAKMTYNEDSIIELFKTTHDKSVIQSIGDDCAVVEIENEIVVTTDSLVEGVHFLGDRHPPYLLGKKSLSVSLSDIAAMGARPQYFLLALSIPKSTSKHWIEEYQKGLSEQAKKYNVQLIGGDTTNSYGKIFINITLIGQGKKQSLKYRSKAKVGDDLYVIGHCGDSALGLELILEGLDENLALKATHFDPLPKVLEGEFLGTKDYVHGMMDLSDGLLNDCPKFMKESNCGIEIDLENLTLSNDLINYCKLKKMDPYIKGYVGGEDYGLLLSVDSKFSEKFEKEFKDKFETPLKKIGKITEKNLVVKLNGQKISNDLKGFNHF